MNTDESIFSVVSVDVVALTYDRGVRRVHYGTHRRDVAPFVGELALPGVVVRSGERLADAAVRALAKLEQSAAPAVLGQLRTFDEPARDPRGPSLSIAMWAVYPPHQIAEDTTAEWAEIGTPQPLAFDHADIILAVQPILADMLWRDLDFTRALTGPEFTATDAVAITAQLTGRDVHRANLNRDLAKTPGLAEHGLAAAAGGRPPKVWRWDEETPSRTVGS